MNTAVINTAVINTAVINTSVTLSVNSIAYLVGNIISDQTSFLQVK
jgi:hypothetical protein